MVSDISLTPVRALAYVALGLLVNLSLLNALTSAEKRPLLVWLAVLG